MDLRHVPSGNPIRFNSHGGTESIASLRTMLSILHALAAFVADLVKSRRRLEAENCSCVIS